MTRKDIHNHDTVETMGIVRGGSCDLQPCACFNCDSQGGGFYKAHDGETKWFMGLDSSGQAHFACEECSVLLFNARPYYRESQGHG
jgi:hypothetical protein